MKSCPQCDSSEFDSAGNCLVCGYRASPETSGPLPSRPAPVTLQGIIEMESPKPVDAGEEDADQPAWRQELSRRLHEIKQKRDADATGQEAATLPFLPPSPAGTPADREPGEDGATRAPRRTRPKPEVKPTAAQPPKEEPAITPAPGAANPQAPLVEYHVEEARRETAQPEPDTPETRSLQELIDNMVSRQPHPELHGPDFRELIAKPLIPQEPPAEKLILLSRTFSGLVDLLVVIVSASAVIFAVDIFEGIEIFDMVSFLHYLALLTVTYFVYSVYFLATGNQTIGMMITDLKLYGVRQARPGLGQVFTRNAAYVLAAACGGLGLLWGIFDQQAMCLHDHLSGTRVERLPEG